MPLTNTASPCNWCIDEEMYRIADETGEPADISKVILSEITQTTRYCLKCSSPFCADHASPVDQSDCCARCLPFEDITEMRTPLVSRDENGPHVHRGYRVVPTGVGYKTLPKAISELTDSELDAFIQDKLKQIAEVELKRDYLRTAQSTAKLEKNEREIAAHRALRGIKIKLPVADPTKGIKITGQKGNGTLKGVSGAGGQQLDLAAFLKFAAEEIKKKKVGTGTVGPVPAVPPSASQTQMTAKITPEQRAVAGSTSFVNAERGGVPPQPATPPQASPASQLSQDEVLENAREAEIEAILNEGEENGNNKD